jgi:DNA-binding NarL/FixJ family response regulator
MPKPRKTRVFVVDDEPLVRRGLMLLLGLQSQIEICGAAGEEPEALAQILNLHPDLAIIDLSLKEGSGLNLIREVHRQSPEVKILVHSMHDALPYAASSFRAGARGYVTKGEGADHLLDAIEKVSTGEVYLSDKLAQFAPQLLRHTEPTSQAPLS